MAGTYPEDRQMTAIEIGLERILKIARAMRPLETRDAELWLEVGSVIAHTEVALEIAQDRRRIADLRGMAADLMGSFGPKHPDVH